MKCTHHKSNKNPSASKKEKKKRFCIGKYHWYKLPKKKNKKKNKKRFFV